MGVGRGYHVDLSPDPGISEYETLSSRDLSHTSQQYNDTACNRPFRTPDTVFHAPEAVAQGVGRRVLSCHAPFVVPAAFSFLRAAGAAAKDRP